MKKKPALGIMLILLLIGTATLALNIQSGMTEHGTLWQLASKSSTTDLYFEEALIAGLIGWTGTFSVGDTDGDTENELLAGQWDGTIYAFSCEEGTYEVVWSEDVVDQNPVIATGDLDNDGIDEILVGGQNSVARVFKYDGANYLEDWNLGFPSNSFGVAIGDADNDGMMEAILKSNDNVYIFGCLVDIDGHRNYVEEYRFTLQWPWGLAINDVDNDGKNELVIGDALYLRVYSYISGVYSLDWQSLFIGQYLWSIATGDIDNDSINEILVGNQEGVVFVFGFSDGFYVEEWRSDVGGFSSVACGDVDVDNVPEMITYAFHPGSYVSTASIYEYNGLYSVQWSIDITNQESIPYNGLTVGDTDNDQIDEIVVGEQWGIIHVFARTIPLAITAPVDIAPDSLNLRSNGQWITAYIQLPEGYNPEDIDASTILLNETLPPVLDLKYHFVTNPSEYLVDHNNDGILERMIRFERTALESLIYNQGIRYCDVALTLAGELLDGTPFEGTDVVFVNYAGDVNNDGKIDIVDAATVSAHWYPGPPTGPLGYDSSSDLNNDGPVNILDSGIVSSNWGQTAP